jgi:hypothetical protein
MLPVRVAELSSRALSLLSRALTLSSCDLTLPSRALSLSSRALSLSKGTIRALSDELSPHDCQTLALASRPCPRRTAGPATRVPNAAGGRVAGSAAVASVRRGAVLSKPRARS